jgi:MoxR-like ATPase
MPTASHANIASPSDTSCDIATGDRHLLRRLNIFGLDHLDAVILAALTDERPLLLIGAHGTAKSELLNRLAAALHLEHRHFNASLISFDDLLGYPVPNEARDALSWLRTPGDLWGAESVFLDEISRCRPETQNKLFSVIHERRVQGLPLEKLRYRWAAMNPPALDDGKVEGDVYAGSLPLDPALSDRFPYVVNVPRLLDLSVADRTAIIVQGGAAPGGDAGLPALVAVARARLGELSDGQRAWAAAWVQGLIVPLHQMGLDISGRRAVALASSALAVHAAHLALEVRSSLPQSAYTALRWGLPQRALGRVIDDAALKAAHRLADHAARAIDGATWRDIRGEADPVRRVAIALRAEPGESTRTQVSQLVLDALASQLPAERRVLAMVLASRFTRDDLLTAEACEQLAVLVEPVLAFAEGDEVSRTLPGAYTDAWEAVRVTIERLAQEGEPLLGEIGNLLYAAFLDDATGLDVARVVARYREWHGLLHPAADGEAA